LGDLADLGSLSGRLRNARRLAATSIWPTCKRSGARSFARSKKSPGYAVVNANYGKYAERFPFGAAKFTKAIDGGGQNAAGELSCGATTPGETAGRFFNGAENAAVELCKARQR
jgi:hypothetical protein